LGEDFYFMQIISLNNHIVRKALCLSLNEMAVLCDIKQMSQEPKFGYTCIKSKEKIAEWLDLSRTTVFTIIDTLIKKGLIEKNEIGLKPTELVYKLDMCQEDIGLWLKNGNVEIVTKKIQDILTPCTDSTDSGLPQYSFCTQVYNIEYKEKLNKKKEFVPPSEEEVLAYFREKGQPEAKARKAFAHYNNFGWKDSKGTQVKNWKQKMQTNWFTDTPDQKQITPLDGDARMMALYEKGYKNCTPEELRWVFDWQHRSSGSQLAYPKHVRLVKPTSHLSKQDCIDADRAAGFN